MAKKLFCTKGRRRKSRKAGSTAKHFRLTRIRLKARRTTARCLLALSWGLATNRGLIKSEARALTLSAIVEELRVRLAL